MATNEVTTNIPEHAHLGAFWNTRARGLGGTPQIPVSTGAEENVLCLRSDRYREDIFLHEFSHGIHLIAANFAISNFDYRLNSLYRQAVSRGLWRNTYADDTKQEYWAEGVQSFFNVEAVGPRGGDGIHNDIDTREELRRYDPNLYNLILEVFPCANTIIDRCSSQPLDFSSIRTDCDKNGRPNPTIGPKPTNRPLTTVSPSSCRDSSTYCHSWAAQGECVRNPAYMLTNYKKSCNRCSSSSCVDNSRHCNYWARTGECQSNPAYMNTDCKKSCNKC